MTISFSLIKNFISSWTPSQFLLVIALTVFIVWILQYYSEVRKFRALNAIPGPLELPLIGSNYLFIGSLSHIFYAFNDVCNKYNGICKLGFGTMQIVVVTDPKLLEVIFNSQNTLNKGDLYRFLKELGGNGLATAPVELWKKNRKLILPTFNQRVLDGFVQTFNENGRLLNERLRSEKSNQHIDLQQHLQEVSLNTIFETAFGVKLSEKQLLPEVCHLLERFSEIMFLRTFVLPLQPEFMFWLLGYRKEMNEILEKMNRITDKIISDKVGEWRNRSDQMKDESEYLEDQGTSKPKRKVFLDLLIELVYEESKVTRQQMQDELKTFVFAGSDTTAETLGFAFTCLGLYPHFQQRVYEEIVNEVGHEQDIRSSDYSKLQYTERFLKEVMRSFPVGPIFARTAINDMKLGPYTIPAGTAIALGIYHVHHNDKYWPNPEKFDPDRFLPGEVAKRHPYSFLPFSAGPRNCIGLQYAMMQMKTMLASVLREFRVFTHYKSIEDVKVESAITIRPVDGFKVYFTHRFPC